MNKGLLIFLLLIPAFAAVGYDLYVYYENQDEGFKFTDLGWLWEHYSPDTHKYAFDQIGEEKWVQYVVPVLSLPALVIALILGATILFFVIVIRAMSSLSASKFAPKSKKGGLGRERDGGKKKFEYKRR